MSFICYKPRTVGFIGSQDVGWCLALVCVLVAQLCPTLCDAMDCGPPGSSGHRILQGRILGWDAMSFSGGIFLTQESNPHLLGLLHWQVASLPLAPPAAATAKSLQSWPTLCDPRDGSPPGSPVPGILQARALEWVAISFSNA